MSCCQSNKTQPQSREESAGFTAPLLLYQGETRIRIQVIMGGLKKKKKPKDMKGVNSRNFDI